MMMMMLTYIKNYNIGVILNLLPCDEDLSKRGKEREREREREIERAYFFMLSLQHLRLVTYSSLLD
jgi:hypothetical protein